MTVDGTYTVDGEATTSEGTQAQSIHITPVDGRFTFYRDCGDLT